jgi:hypothetical protein
MHTKTNSYFAETHTNAFFYINLGKIRTLIFAASFIQGKFYRVCLQYP